MYETSMLASNGNCFSAVFLFVFSLTFHLIFIYSYAELFIFACSQLPITAQCTFCNLDGWHKQPVTSPQVKSQITQELGPSSLMECSVCYEITHPECVQKACGDSAGVQITGVVNEDLPNSWECPLCCMSGKNTDYKVSFIRKKSINQMDCCTLITIINRITQMCNMTIFAK